MQDISHLAMNIERAISHHTGGRGVVHDDALDKYHNQRYELVINPTTGATAGWLTGTQTLQFVIPDSPNLALRDSESIYLRVELQETGGTYPLWVAFPEGWGDQTTGVVFKQGTKPIGNPISTKYQISHR